MANAPGDKEKNEKKNKTLNRGEKKQATTG